MNVLQLIVEYSVTGLIFIIIAQVAISWLIAFGIINTGNPQARNLVQLLKKVTDPIYKPVQKFIPPIGGIDITPIIVIFLVQFIGSFILSLLNTSGL